VSGQTSAWHSESGKARSDSEDELIEIANKQQHSEKFIYIVVRVDSKEPTPWDCYNLLGAFPSYEASIKYIEREKEQLIRMFGVDQHKRNPFVIRQVPIYATLDEAPSAEMAETAGRRAPYW